MVRKQTFDEFLNSPGPFTPRGRGRGRGRGGGGGGRGNRGGGYGATPRSSFNTDYTNVALDYSKLNSKTYTKLEGFDVAPFGPDSNKNQPSSPYTPSGRGRGRGRGALGSSRLGVDSSPAHTPAGARTPVTGLGYHGQGHSFQNSSRSDQGVVGSGRNGRGGKRHVMGDTVGKSGVMWGGGSAPIFVKAGELFKDGEVDVVRLDQESGELTVDVENLNDAAVPQMDDPRDEYEIEIPTESGTGSTTGISHLPDASIWTPEKVPATQQDAEADTSITTDAELAKGFSEAVVMQDEQGSPSTSSEIEDEDLAGDRAQVVQVEVDMVDEEDRLEEAKDTEEEPTEEPGENYDDPFFIDVERSHAETVTTEDALFFVDTDPVTTVIEETVITYDTTHPSITLGHGRSPSPEAEEILFKPRQYAKPQPISVNVPAPAKPTKKKVSESPRQAPEPASIVPSSLNRRQKKALKREKRTRNKGKAREKNRKRLQAYEGSDIEWGSDGPPTQILDVEGIDISDSDFDEAILRDYLDGTKRGVLAQDVGGENTDGEDEIDSDLEEEISKAFDAAALGADEEFELSSGEEDNPDIEATSTEEDDEAGEGSDDEDDAESSELGEVEFQWGQAMEDSDEDEDDDDMFKGHDDWNDTDWFIKNLEEALDGNVDMKDRKSRNALFSSIENGDFGDDWGTVPVKRNKKGSGIPLGLQGQWEKDRQRKAEKKRQRDLDRLADLIDPHPSTHGKKKGKAKGLSRIEQAKLAHLIPESASRVADMFDVPSDFDEPGSSSRSRMNGRLAALLPGGRGFASIDDGIRAFIADEGKQAYSVPPMDKEGRKKVHMLAECYGLSSKSRGKGKARFTVLTKTRRTGQDVNEDKIARLVAAAPFSGGAFFKALYSKQKKEKGKKGPGDRGSSARMRDGETVGEGAERIGNDNIGHQLLSKMGWAEGARIGRSGGLDNPVVAIVKSTKAGLGS